MKKEDFERGLERLPRTRVRPRPRRADIGIRTSNPAEISVCETLEHQGWRVMKSGWPDFLAVKDGKVRFIEVKPHQSCGLSRRQREVAEVLASLGIDVELITPADLT